jgi:hypothetical protein
MVGATLLFGEASLQRNAKNHRGRILGIGSAHTRWRRIGWGHMEGKLKRMSRSVMLHVLESNSWYASIVRVSIEFASDGRMP